MYRNKSKSSSTAQTIEISDSEDEKENKGSLDLRYFYVNAARSWSDFRRSTSTKVLQNVNKGDDKDSRRKQFKGKFQNGEVSEKNKSNMKIDGKNPLKINKEKVSKEASTSRDKHVNKKSMLNKAESSEESEDNLDSFLAKFTNKKKTPEKMKDDLSNFIVADDDLDSDEFATPKLSLRERIMKGSTTTSSYRTKTQIPDFDSDDELPEIETFPKNKSRARGKREKPRLPSSKETSEDDAKETSDDEDYVRPLFKQGRPKRLT